jgi:hypothetical protein
MMPVTVPQHATPSGLIPIAKQKTYQASDGTVSQKMALDVMGFSENEVRKLMIEIAGDETAEQIRIGNPPAFTNVDGTRGRSVVSAKKRVTISYGVRLKVEALNMLKRALMTAIAGATTARSGNLSNPANWDFHYVRNGHRADLPLSGSSGIPMGPRDFIVLMPNNVRNDRSQAYATAANMRVAGTGKLSFRRTVKGRVARKNQRIGFLALASRAAQTSPLFAGFALSAGFTIRHALRGEVTKLGGVRSGFIRIRPKIGR